MKYKVQESRILKGLDFDVLRILDEYNCFVAGGTIVSVFSNVPINDYDIYCTSSKTAGKVCELLKQIGFDLKVVSKNAYSLVRKSHKKENQRKQKIQIIKYEKFCNNNPHEIFKYFDFHCCMGAYSFKTGEFYFDEYFLTDNVEKRLRINTGTEYPICTLYRTIKYQKKGYFMPGIEMIKIALAINDLKMNSYNDLKEQLMGIDTQFLLPLTDKLLNEENKKYDFSKFKDELANFYTDYFEKIITNAFDNKESEDLDEYDIFEKVGV